MNYIPIRLTENPSIPDPEITDDNLNTIRLLLSDAIEAQKIRQHKNDKKLAIDKNTISAIAELLENPDGIVRADLLTTAESENIISLVIRIRNRLKKDNLYTLKKRGKGSSTVYYTIKA